MSVPNMSAVLVIGAIVVIVLLARTFKGVGATGSFKVSA